MISMIASFAIIAASDDDAVINYSQYVQPCQSWRYSTEVRGYVCSWYAMSTQFAEQRDLDEANREIDRLDRRVQDLEDRVARLENPSR